jgi:hypothetical protein
MTNYINFQERVYGYSIFINTHTVHFIELECNFDNTLDIWLQTSKDIYWCYSLEQLKIEDKMYNLVQPEIYMELALYKELLGI